MSSNVHPMKRLWKILNAERQEVRSIFTFAIFHGLVNLSLPLGIQAIINFIQAGRLSTSWYVLVGVVLLGIIITGILQLKQLAVSETIEQRLFANATYELSWRLPRVSMSGVEGKYVPELMNRFFEVMTVQKGMTKLLIEFSTAVIQIVFGLLLLSLYHQLFLFLGLILVLILYLIFYFTGPGGLRTSMEESKYKFEVAHWLQEVARTMGTFKLSGESELPLQKTDALTKKYLGARLRHFFILMTQYRAMIFFKFLVAAALIIGGSILVFNKQINIGQFVAAEIIVLLVMSSVEKLILNMSTVYDVLTSLDKLGVILDLDTERENGIAMDDKVAATGLSVSVKNLTFHFPHNVTPVLKNVSFQINSGETVCITGPNGSGKTTLLRLMSGFYEDFEGSIAYNDLPLGNLRLDSLRAMVGENFTEQDVFKGTVMENISCGIPGVTLDKVMRAASMARLSDFVQALPEGYNTMLDPEGLRLPSSIVRKIILARCFVNDPKLLLIEDNMTALSQEERAYFFDMIFEQCRHVTTLIITTDPKIAARCSRVYSLIDGVLTPQN